MKYGFSEAEPGGFVRFHGVMASDKKATSVDVDRDNGKVTVTYEDGSKYEYTAVIEATETGYRIIDENGTWFPPPAP